MICEQKVTKEEMLKASVGSFRYHIKNIMSLSSNLGGLDLRLHEPSGPSVRM